MKHRMSLLLSLALSAMMAMSAGASSHAQQRTTAKEPPATGKARPAARASARFVPTAWQVKCIATGGKNNTASCILSGAVVEARTRRILVKLEIPDHRKFLTLQLPHGLDLRKPVELRVGGKQLGKASFVTSRPAGSFARMKLDKKTLAAIGKGKDISIGMKIFNGSDMSVRMSLKGFSAALRKLR